VAHQEGQEVLQDAVPNKCRCLKTVKLTPSDPNYLRNLLGQLGRATCWNKEEPE